MAEHTLIVPVLALVLWTLVIWLWMYATRIPAIQKAQLDPQAAARTRMLNLPPEVMWVSDNYNHLMEQPTVFYATALALAVLGDQSTLALGLAWTYVGLRVVHSLWQVLVNQILIRFALFSISSLVLFALIARAAVLVF